MSLQTHPVDGVPSRTSDATVPKLMKVTPMSASVIEDAGGFGNEAVGEGESHRAGKLGTDDRGAMSFKEWGGHGQRRQASGDAS